MKKYLWLLLFLIPVSVSAQEAVYPWQLSAFGGGASLCDESGCFGPSGYVFGASFGRHFTDRWSFELDGAYARSTETLAPRFDTVTGTLFFPELQRSRVWGGGTFLASIGHFGSSSDFFIALGLVGAYEQQVEKTPEGIFHAPTRNIGIKGGVCGGAGMNLWFSESWGVRPEIRFYGTASPLSGVRYTAGLIKKF